MKAHLEKVTAGLAFLAFLVFAPLTAHADLGTISPKSASGHVSSVVIPPQPNDSATTYLNASSIATAVAGTEITVSAKSGAVSGRNVRLTIEEASGSSLDATIRVYGKDQFGRDVSEDFSPANGDTVTDGSKIFATVSKIRVVTVAANAASDTVSLGIGDIVGLAKMFSTDLHEIFAASYSCDIYGGSYTDVAPITINTTNFDSTYFAVKAAAWDCITANDVDAGETGWFLFVTDPKTPDNRYFPAR